MSETFTSRRARRSRAAPSAVSVRHTAPPPLRCNRSAPPPCTPPCPATPRRLRIPPAGQPPRLPRHVCPAVSARHASPHLSIRTARRTPFRAGTPAAQKHTARKETPSAPLPFWFFRRYACFVFFGVMPVCEAPCAAPPCASAARRSCRRAYRPPPPAAGRGRARC